MDKLRKDKRVKFVENDELIPADFIPNDSLFYNQWEIPYLKIDAVWNITTGNNVKIAVLDTGVAAHSDLNANLLPGWNVLLNNNNTNDTNKHGTWVAGVIAATMNNNAGIAGIANTAKIIPIVIANENAYAYWSDIATGIYKAKELGANIINISYSAYTSSTVIAAAKVFVDNGGFVFVSSGNDGLQKTNPNSPYLIVVGATGKSNECMSWSNKGPMVDISAPGGEIPTTTINNTYTTVKGTSIASPIAAATFALVYDVNRNTKKLSNSNLIDLFFTSSMDYGQSGYDYCYGFGIVNPKIVIDKLLN